MWSSGHGDVDPLSQKAVAGTQAAESVVVRERSRGTSDAGSGT